MKTKATVLFVVVLIMSATDIKAETPVKNKLEENYFSTLDDWVKRGGRVDEVQNVVVKTCGKLVMLEASVSEKMALTTTKRDEFDFRVDVCTKMTVNRVHPQPEFERKEIVKQICDDTKVTLFKKMCRRSGLRHQ